MTILSGFAQNNPTNEAPNLKGKKILIVYGGWPGHKPKAFVDKITPWLQKEGAELTISASLDSYTDEKLMSETDLVIQSWTMGKISEEQVNGLLKAVRNGTGLAGCHGGIGDSFREKAEYLFMVGGQWAAHPGGKINYEVTICDVEDPITEGLSDFKVEDTEQYYMLVDPNSKVLATTTFTGENSSWIDGAVIPVVWKKYYGKGRVYNLTIGHEPKDFDNPSVWTMLKRGFAWAAESKYQAKENLISPVYKSKD
ncbi:ThuA domain-containing protein [Ancylomarina sp. 16SWW S1-10-2]|uniref:ThuA domain-containing protein n=1 Tax=Ancylomarina sp. 16SWW S1-10-2 TaxID=2499681 RepID=UPI0012AD3400|nr:ThuA domain-containing protein [Ancylomarina sp. 16SWW S1-10-2]MRT91624.1 ThuA domain-containing protein [Ancylomarina sp. 16SWW S1-10-2]